MNAPGITLDELLTDNESATARWKAWFGENPAALDAPCDIYNSGTVRGLLKHIFAVELRHSQRLLGEEVSAYDAIPVGHRRSVPRAFSGGPEPAEVPIESR